MTSRLCIDVGGTFTDLLLVDDDSGRRTYLKTPTTPADPAAGILSGIEQITAEAGIPTAEIGAVLHGCSMAADAVRRKTGARVGLLVTAGFEHVLHLARARTPAPMGGWTTMKKSAPLADIEFTYGVTERMNARGDVVTPLDEAKARAAVRALLDAGADSIVVAFLHAHANPAHEQRIKALVADMAADMPVALSSEMSSRHGEYERTLVAVMNAFLRPGMRRYLDDIETKLRGADVAAPISMIRPDGGRMAAMYAIERPAQTMLSGPAGAASGAAAVAAQAGHQNAISFDMGGTSTGVAVIRNGEGQVGSRMTFADDAVAVPSIDMHRIGRGGGAVAHVPVTGALRVGPEGAGAVPGPACYGRGGDRPTVTDANAVLGRLPETLLGGRMTLDTRAAEEAMGKLARTLGLDTYRTALAIVDVCNEDLAGEVRLAAVAHGLDAADMATVAGGGAGPMHAVGLARLIGCYPVIVPPMPGMLSTCGFLNADIRHECGHAVMRLVDEIDSARLGDAVDRLAADATALLEAEQVEPTARSLRFEADLRYLRQGSEFTFAVEPAGLRNGGLQDLAASFAAAHERRHGVKLDQPIELLAIRAVGLGRTAQPADATVEAGGPDASAAMVDQRQVYFDQGFVATDIYDRALLRAGNRLTGPAIVEQADATTVVHPGHVAEVDAHGNMLIRPEAVRH